MTLFIIKSPSITKALTTLLMLTLVACSGNKVIVTTDDSADYQTANQLPPLKKTVGDLPSASTSPAESDSEPNTSSSGVGISASILQVSDQVARLNISASIDVAWDFLLNDIRNSDITLQGRNRSANQIEIGCGTISDGSAEVEEGGWSLFNDELIYEYCVLQLDESREQTRVSLLDRRGEEVASADAMSVFNKIIGN